MKNFINFINESVNDYNLYHFTNIDALFEIIADGSIFPFYDKLLKDGVSTTRNKNLKWLNNNIRLVLDKKELSYNYKIKPYHWFNMKHFWQYEDDYRKYGDVKPKTNQNIPANQYEERIITDKPLPIKYIKSIDIIGYISEQNLKKLKKLTTIPINIIY